MLNSQIRSSSDRIKTLTTELTPLRQESARIEAEIGPIKYVADLIYGESDKGLIEKAVRWVIVIIVLVFDPLAIILLIAANRELKNYNRFKPAKPKPTAKKVPKKNIAEFDYPDNDKVLIDKDQVHEIPKEIIEKVFKKKK